MRSYGQYQMLAMQKHRQKVALTRTAFWFLVAAVVITLIAMQ